METKELIGKELVLGLCGEDYIAWAERMLEGCSNENVEILAALGIEGPINFLEAKKYYQKAIAELHIQVPTKKECIMAYARSVAKKIVDKKIAPVDGATILFRVCFEADYPPELIVWYVISEEPGHVAFNDYPLDYNILREKGEDCFIVDVAEKFLAYE